ncbi:DUF6221 family protein [Streptomyces jumonjinensis]|uniref:Uncharacterized protein n=1 Tax=Streptomyces jumonjinensis TaxID=1945 RepID=A0A646KLS2_STRJU|nr:DUF6221 family protein [Streptomyces jumonjinensis]MQT03165.1 hypothetical protein [Streptomyces jumonjinensis]
MPTRLRYERGQHATTTLDFAPLHEHMEGHRFGYTTEVSTMSDHELIAFLRARHAEDRQAALDATWDDADSRHWHAHYRTADDRWVLIDDLDEGIEVRCTAADDGGVVRHMARQDPARTLAETEAKQQTVTEFEEALVSLSTAGPGTTPHDVMTGAANTLRRLLHRDATLYASHPDHQESWHPEE